MVRTLRALWVLLLLTLVGILGTTSVAATENEKVGICHRTASDSNPYVYIEVDENALSPGHLDNSDPGHKPTFWKSDGTFRGEAHLAGDAKDDYLANGPEDCQDSENPSVPAPSDSSTPVLTTAPTPMPPGTAIPNTAMETPTGNGFWISLLIAALVGATVFYGWMRLGSPRKR